MSKRVPAGHDRVEADPQLVDSLKNAPRDGRLQQQSHAGGEGLGVRDQISRREQGQTFQDPHQPGTTTGQLLKGFGGENEKKKPNKLIRKANAVLDLLLYFPAKMFPNGTAETQKH